MTWMTSHLLALLLGFILDLAFGDPYWLPHPVRFIGNLISGLEAVLRKAFPKNKKGELFAGAVLTAITALLPASATVLLLLLCRVISPFLELCVQAVICYQMLATRSLCDESMKVCNALKAGNIGDARHYVSMIVGRDTERLDEAGIARAAVETVAENASDGVIAPLIFMAIGGAPLGVFYKACNTMDSMIGYKNDRYLFFGKAAARLDDLLNFIPARISGLFMCAAAAITGFDAKGAFSIFARDRKNHKSPNSAHTEAACAGALNIRLAGPSYYFGKFTEKPFIGDPGREVEASDIARANRLMYASAVISMLVFCILPLVVSSILYSFI